MPRDRSQKGAGIGTHPDQKSNKETEQESDLQSWHKLDQKRSQNGHVFGTPNGVALGTQNGDAFSTPNGVVFGAPNGVAFGTPNGAAFGTQMGGAFGTANQTR